MHYFQVLAITSAIILSCCLVCPASEEEEKRDTFHEDWAPCMQKCAGVQGDGWVCMENGGGTLAVLGQCLTECREFKPHENQTQCFCDYCKQGFIFANLFCTEPGAGSLRGTEECDAVVCSSEGNFHVGALACQQRMKEQRQELRFQEPGSWPKLKEAASSPKHETAMNWQKVEAAASLPKRAAVAARQKSETAGSLEAEEPVLLK